LTETCDPKNALQLITKVQVASNNTDDSCLLVEALPNLKQRTNLDTLYTDGGHGGPGSDAVLDEQHVTLIQTAIRGSGPNHKKLSLSDFSVQLDKDGKPVQVTCPQKQQVPLYLTSIRPFAKLVRSGRLRNAHPFQVNEMDVISCISVGSGRILLNADAIVWPRIKKPTICGLPSKQRYDV
jgi:hypothetical protein